MCGLGVQILLGSVYLLLDVSTRVCQPHIPAGAWTAECHFNDCVHFVFVCNHLSNIKCLNVGLDTKKGVLIINDCILYQEESILTPSSVVKSSALWEFYWKGQRCCVYESLSGSVIAVCDVNVSYCSDLRFTFIQIGWFVSEFGLCTL